MGVPYQAGTEAATAAVNGGGGAAAAPLGPLDNVRMAHLLPSAKTSIAQSRPCSRSEKDAVENVVRVIFTTSCNKITLITIPMHVFEFDTHTLHRFILMVCMLAGK